MKKIVIIAILTAFCLSFSEAFAQKGTIRQQLGKAPEQFADKSIGEMSEPFRKTLAVFLSASAFDTLNNPYSFEKLEIQKRCLYMAGELAGLIKNPADHFAFEKMVEPYMSKLPPEVRNDFLLEAKDKATKGKKDKNARLVYNVLFDMNVLNHEYNQKKSKNTQVISGLSFFSGEFKSFRFEINKNLSNTDGFGCSTDSSRNALVKVIGRIDIKDSVVANLTDYQIFLIFFYGMRSSDANYIGNWTAEENEHLANLKSSCPLGMQKDTTDGFHFMNGEITSINIKMNDAGEIAYIFDLKKETEKGYTKCDLPSLKNLLDVTDHNYIGNLGLLGQAEFNQRLRNLLCTPILTVQNTVGVKVK